jgi:L-rhamnose mutarotase
MNTSRQAFTDYSIFLKKRKGKIFLVHIYVFNNDYHKLAMIIASGQKYRHNMGDCGSSSDIVYRTVYLVACNIYL